MTFLDTNVVIYASQPRSSFHGWARDTIANAVGGKGAVVNAVGLAELCVGDPNPTTVASRLRGWGIAILDLPAATSQICAQAFGLYLQRRSSQVGGSPPKVPLPDFFIGAHCQLMGWELATADVGRFQTYFPSVIWITPD